MNSLQQVIDEFKKWLDVKGYNDGERNIIKAVIYELEDLPPSLPERDIPLPPNETTDFSWGIAKRQAVCPRCDYYLGDIQFIGDGKDKRVTYCETCGQAIDWKGWDDDE